MNLTRRENHLIRLSIGNRIDYLNDLLKGMEKFPEDDEEFKNSMVNYKNQIEELKILEVKMLEGLM
jgi:hypothetical protein